jgi:hypothetical protein
MLGWKWPRIQRMSIENFTFEDWIGVAGAILLLVAYAHLLTGRWRASDEIYRLLTWSGAAAVAYTLAFKYSPAPLVVALVWIGASLVTWLRPQWVEPGRRRAKANPSSGVGPDVGPDVGQAPRTARLDRASAIRALDAAIRSLDALSSDVARRPLPGFGAAPVLESISLELQAIQSNFPRDDIAAALGSPSYETDLLFAAARDTVRQAMQAPSGETPPTIEPALSTQLVALRRVLEMQRRRLGPPALLTSGPMPPAGAAVAQTSEGRATAFREADSAGDTAFKPDEAVFAAAVMDKLYASAAFKVIAGALVSAALLAGAGTVYLGSHTLTLRADLEKTEANGRQDIENSKNVLLAAIDKQDHALKMMQTEIQEKKNDFGQKVTDGKDLIDRITRNFDSKSDDLKEQIVTKLVTRLGEDLKQPMSDISKAIREKGEEAKNEIGQLVTQRVDPLKTRATTIDGDFGRLSAAVQAHDQELQKLAPPLGRLRELEPQLGRILTALNTVQNQQKELADAVANAVSRATAAGDQANAARQSAELAESARQAVLAAIRKLGEEVSNQERSVGALAVRFASVSKEIDALEGKVRVALPPAVDLAALARQTEELAKGVDAIKVRVRTLEDLPKVATAAGSPEFQRQVDEVLRQMSGARNKLDEIDEAVAKSRTQVDRAASFSQEAENSAKQAERERTTAVTVVDAVRKDAGEQQRELGRTEKSIETLNKQVADMQANLPDKVLPPDLAPFNSRLDELQKQTKLLAKRIGEIDEKLKPPLPGFPKSEVELTKTQIAAIQQRLADLGFDPKGADGAIGDNTRAAIRGLQRSTGQPVTGTLTAPLIAQLLSPLQPAKP